MLLELLLGAIIGLLLLCAGLLGWLLRRSGHDALLRVTARLEALRESQERITRAVVDEIGFGRREAAQASDEQSARLTRALHELRDTLLDAIASDAELGKAQLAEQREAFEARAKRTETVEQRLLQAVQHDARRAQEATAALLIEHRLELQESLRQLHADAALAGERDATTAHELTVATREVRAGLAELGHALRGWLEEADGKLVSAAAQSALQAEGAHVELSRELAALRGCVEESSSRIGEAQARERGSLATSVENALGSFQDDHARRLERIRQALEERLPMALDQRLAESLRPASLRLDEIRRALDELRALVARPGSLLS